VITPDNKLIAGQIKIVVFDYGGVIFGNLHWYNGMFKLAEDLKTKGYRTALLSNMYKPVAWMAHRLPTTRHFDPLVISADVGCSKPHPNY
jgi:FMN phosphatase YigB (HAD superfamily)